MSSLCPDCPPVVEKLDKAGIKYLKIDITNSMAELKKFLKVRDDAPYFDEIKKNNKVGVPTMMNEEGEFFNPELIKDFVVLK